MERICCCFRIWRQRKRKYELREALKREREREAELLAPWEDCSFHTDEDLEDVEAQLLRPIVDKSRMMAKSEQLAWNILVERYPPEVLHIVFCYLDPNLKRTLPSFVNRPKWGDKVFTTPEIIVEKADFSLNQPSLIFTIGPPGSGKTTWAKAMFYRDHIVAADDFFEESCGGRFDQSRIAEAHDWCFERVCSLLDSGQNAVVNNTNTDLSQMYRYIAYLLFRELPHKVVYAKFHTYDVDLLLWRNVHQVPRHTISRMLKKFVTMGKPSIDRILYKGPYNPLVRQRRTEYIYNAVFLTESAKEELHRWLDGRLEWDLPNQAEHMHVTLQYKPVSIEKFLPLLNKPVSIKVLGLAQTRFIQALWVEILDSEVSKMCESEYPHISISWADCIRPVSTNQLLQFGPAPVPPEDELILDGYCDGLTKNGWMTECHAPKDEEMETMSLPNKLRDLGFDTSLPPPPPGVLPLLPQPNHQPGPREIFPSLNKSIFRADAQPFIPKHQISFPPPPVGLIVGPNEDPHSVSSRRDTQNPSLADPTKPQQFAVEQIFHPQQSPAFAPATSPMQQPSQLNVLEDSNVNKRESEKLTDTKNTSWSYTSTAPATAKNVHVWSSTTTGQAVAKNLFLQPVGGNVNPNLWAYTPQQSVAQGQAIQSQTVPINPYVQFPIGGQRIQAQQPTAMTYQGFQSGQLQAQNPQAMQGFQTKPNFGFQAMQTMQVSTGINMNLGPMAQGAFPSDWRPANLMTHTPPSPFLPCPYTNGTPQQASYRSEATTRPFSANSRPFLPRTTSYSPHSDDFKTHHRHPDELSSEDEQPPPPPSEEPLELEDINDYAHSTYISNTPPTLSELSHTDSEPKHHLDLDDPDELLTREEPQGELSPTSKPSLPAVVGFSHLDERSHSSNSKELSERDPPVLLRKRRPVLSDSSHPKRQRVSERQGGGGGSGFYKPPPPVNWRKRAEGSGYPPPPPAETEGGVDSAQPQCLDDQEGQPSNRDRDEGEVKMLSAPWEPPRRDPGRRRRRDKRLDEVLDKIQFVGEDSLHRAKEPLQYNGYFDTDDDQGEEVGSG